MYKIDTYVNNIGIRVLGQFKNYSVFFKVS